MSAAADQQVEWRRPDIAIIDNALDSEALAHLCRVADRATFEAQPLGRAVLRERDRSVIDDLVIANLLWRCLVLSCRL